MWFNPVVATISNEYTTEIQEIILQPPDDKNYSTLKEHLIKRTVVTERKHLILLITSEELGNKKPVQILWRMQQFMKDSTGPKPGQLSPL